MSFSEEQHAFYRALLGKAAKRGEHIKSNLEKERLHKKKHKHGKYDSRQSRIVADDSLEDDGYTLCDDVCADMAGLLLVDDGFDNLDEAELEPNMKWNGKPFISMKW